VEIGFLLERLAQEDIRGEDVRVLIEDDGSQRRAGGREPGPDGSITFVSFGEGGRTRYHGDLVLCRAVIPTWADHGTLRELLENIAGD
jgi:hypothetical protein